jgi:hypothetical protein
MLLLTHFAPLLVLLPNFALAFPLSSSTAAATIGKIRGVRDPIYHLYLQASSKSPSIPVLGPEASADEVSHLPLSLVSLSL